MKIFLIIFVFESCVLFNCVNSFKNNNSLRFPPLYSLQSWSDCQNIGDTYCLIDALLVPDNNHDTTLINEITNYSSNKLKHYNRTIIHRGICVSRCGNYTKEDDVWPDSLQECVSDNTLQEYGLRAQVLSVGYCTTRRSESITSNGDRIFSIICLVLLGLGIVATVLQILGEKCTKWEGNKYIQAFSIKNNWSILTYDRSKPLTDERMKAIVSIEGIRLLAILCVIFSHVLFIFIYSYTDNPEYIENMYDQTGWRIVLNSPVWVQAFFSLSAFLTAYMALIYSEKHKFTWKTVIVGIVNRWIRLTPTAIFALWFTMTWFPRLGSGPQWPWLVEREASDCQERWWYHALYIHNHLPLGKFCMGHTWYLAVDMQLHIVGLVLLSVCIRWRRVVWPLLGVLLAASAIASGLVVYLYELTPIVTAQAPESLRDLFAGNDVLKLLYIPSWLNAVGYICGLGTAFLLYNIQQNSGKLNQSKVFQPIFQLSIFAASVVVMSGAVFLTSPPPGLMSAAVYSTLDRTLVSICFNVFLLGCFIGCKTHLRGMLEWRGVYVLGRLSYCAFLLHFIVLRVLVASNTQLVHMSILACISLLITASTLTYLISVPVCLLVEIPGVQLWKAVTMGRPARVQPPPPQPQSPVAKPFDLVSQLRRNCVDV